MERHLKLFALSHRALLKRKLESMGKVEKISKGSTKSDKRSRGNPGECCDFDGEIIHFTCPLRADC